MKKMKAKLQFILDKLYDERMIYQMLKSQKSNKDLKYQSKVTGINFDIAKKIAKASNPLEVRILIKEIVKQRYEQNLKKIEKSKYNYQKSWDEINNNFFCRLTELTDFQPQYEKYYCVISAFHPGISSWGGNKIARKFGFEPLKQRKITAHEIIISHFFSLIDKHYPKVKDDQQVWQLAEIYAFVITSKDNIMKSFWPWDKSAVDKGHNYSQLIPLQRELTSVLLKKGLKDFIKIGLMKTKSRLKVG